MVVDKQKLRKEKVKKILKAKRDKERHDRKVQLDEWHLAKATRQMEGTNNDGQIINIHKNLPKRNEPCFCGSKKKFKFCHWEEAQSQIHTNKARLRADPALEETLQNSLKNILKSAKL